MHVAQRDGGRGIGRRRAPQRRARGGGGDGGGGGGGDGGAGTGGGGDGGGRTAALQRRYRPRAPNLVRLQGEGKFCWTLKAFSRLSRDERVYSPPFYHGGIAFMLLLFPRGNQQREYASLYVSVADKTKLPPSWRRQLHFSLCVVDQKESLCSVTKSTHGELSNSVLDWGFTELIPLATLHSPSHGYILDDTLQFTIQFERVAEDGSGRSSSTRPRTGQTQTLNPALNLVPHP